MPLRRDLLGPGSFSPLSATSQLTDRGFRAAVRDFPRVLPTVGGFGGPGVSTSGFNVTGDPRGRPQPRSGILGTIQDIVETGTTVVDVLQDIGVITGDDSVPGRRITGVEDPGPCPGVLSVRLPDGSCLNIDDVGPGGDPAITGQVQTNGVGVGFGPPVNGRFGVGIIPRVEAQTVRRCPRGMSLGKDGVCYDGLSRNSPKREWPMGMKPLLTPGERNAIRIAGRAAGKLSRSQKTLKKTARALAKVC